jgi:tetratricopeptide (TPR) repeat protein
MNKIETSPFITLTNEIKVEIFSYLSELALCRIAQVCKDFKSISQNNILWKPLYCRKWGLSKDWQIPYPHNWKNYFERVYQAEKVYQAKKDPKSSESKEYSFYWGRGCPIESIKKHQGADTNKNLILAELYAIMGNVNKAQIIKNAIQLSVKLSKKQELHLSLISILCHLNKKDYDKALNEYNENRENFIKISHLNGLWISNLIHSLSSRTPTISLPENKYSYETELEYVEKLKGASIIWMEQGKESASLTTIHCLSEIVQRIKKISAPSDTAEKKEALFFKQFIALNNQNNISATFWEKLGDLAYKIKNPEINAIELYIRNLKLNIYISLENKTRITAKLCRSLVDSKNNYNKNNSKEIQLVLQILDQHIKSKSLLNPDFLSVIMDFIMAFEIDTHYPKVLDLSKRIDLNNSNQDLKFFYAKKIKLCQLVNDTKNAISSWKSLCIYLNENSTPKQENELQKDKTPIDIYPMIYRILDSDDKACEEMISTKPDCIQAHVGIAYAYYRMNNVESAIKVILSIKQYIESDDIHWLYEYSKADFRAIVAYSLTLQKDQQLEDYYLDMSEYSSNHDFYIYHNLATRLFYQGYIDKALKYIEMAFEHGSEAESYIIKGLCHLQKKELEASQKAFEQAYQLDSSMVVDHFDYPQEQLLIIVQNVES